MSNTRMLPYGASLRRPRGVSLMTVHRVMAVGGLALLLAVTLLLLWRRVAGALLQPLSPLTLLAVELVVVAAALGIRRSLRQLAANCSCPRPRLLAIAVSLAVLALTIGLCIRGTPAIGVVTIGVLVVTEETWAWRQDLRPFRLPPLPPLVRQPVASQPEEGFRADSLPHEETFPAERILQQLTRSRSVDGAEAVSGWLRANFAPGQRTASVHVAFCPPLDAVPELAVEQVDGPESRIKTAQVLPYGVRLDLKLAAACDASASVLMEFSARTEPT